MGSPSYFSDHTYSDKVTNGELLAEIEARIAVTPWRWAFPLGRSEWVRLRLARLYLTGTARQRTLLALTWGLTSSLLGVIFGAVGSWAGLTVSWSLYHDLYFALFMGLGLALIGRWTMNSTGMGICYEIAREMDARNPVTG